MNQFSRFFEQVREKVNVSDIVRAKISLSKKGQEYLGLCPFHQEKTPSFTVNDQKKFYHCFGCGAHGDGIKFLAETSGFSYMDAAKKIAEENGIKLPKQSAEQQRIFEAEERIIKALSVANEFFQKDSNRNVMEYLASRNISENSIKQYELGFSSAGKSFMEYMEKHHVSQRTMLEAGLIGRGDDGSLYPVFRKRIMFPIKNIYGKIIAFGGRILGDAMPKYLNSPESLVFKKSETLYGEDIATGAAYQKKRVIIVEGYMDVIAMHQAGYKETVATLGTAVTKDHLTKLWRIADELIFCLDGDDAGIRAMKKAISLLLPTLGENRRGSFAILPSKMDPDDVIRKQGKDHLEKLIKNRLATSDMIWYLETKNKKFKKAEDKANLESKLEKYVSHIEDKILSGHIKREFKNRIWNLNRTSAQQNQNNIPSDVNSLPEVDDNIKIIEYNLFAIIIRHPELFDQEENYIKFSEITFSQKELTKLQSLLIELYSGNSSLNADLIKENMQKSSFSDLFVLLSSPETSFVDILSLDNSKADCNLLWELFVKKHELETLKTEFASVVNSKHEERFAKASAYLEEINKTELSIAKLQEKLAS